MQVSCRVTNSVIRYLESSGYDTAPLIAGLPYSRDFLTDPFNWVSYEIREQMCQRASELANDEALMYRVGLATPKLKPLGGIENMVRLLASPRMVYRSIPKYASLFDRVFKFKTTIIDDNKAIVTMSLPKDYPVSKDSCYYAQGMLAAIPTLWALPPAEVHEKQCMCHAGNGNI